MSGITRYIYENLAAVDASGAVDYTIPGYITLALIFVLSAIVYKLGFAKTLPLWQNAIIYIFLFLGCIMLTFFAFFLPMVEGLIVAALILIVYKSRLWREKREEQKAVAK
ncbi:YlaH-like family protein [Lysinibacillus sp. KU-BSD001]